MPAATQVFVDDLDELELTEEDTHHLSQVLRLAPGEMVIASDGAGAWRTCRYTGGSAHSGHRRAAGRSRMLEADGPLVREPAATSEVVVGFAPVKGERPEWVVQKLTELGVDRIAVLRSSRSVVRWERGRERAAIERLKRVSRQAAAQSRRARLPRLIGVVSLGQLRESVSPGALALAEPGADPPLAALSAVAVGPEGGWDDAERDGADQLVGLGQGILRAETAAVAAGYLLCALRDRIVLAAGGPGASPDRRDAEIRGGQG